MPFKLLYLYKNATKSAYATFWFRKIYAVYLKHIYFTDITNSTYPSLSKTGGNSKWATQHIMTTRF